MCEQKNKFRTMYDIFDEIMDFSNLSIDIDKYGYYPSKQKNYGHDVIENDSEYIIEIPLIGVKKEDTSINYDNDYLIINAERNERKGIKYNRKETYFGVYEKKIKLPNTVDKEKITAIMEHGLLVVTIPKINKDTLLNRTIEIK